MKFTRIRACVHTYHTLHEWVNRFDCDCHFLFYCYLLLSGELIESSSQQILVGQNHARGSGCYLFSTFVSDSCNYSTCDGYSMPKHFPRRLFNRHEPVELLPYYSGETDEIMIRGVLHSRQTLRVVILLLGVLARQNRSKPWL